MYNDNNMNNYNENDTFYMSYGIEDNGSKMPENPYPQIQPQAAVKKKKGVSKLVPIALVACLSFGSLGLGIGAGAGIYKDYFSKNIVSEAQAIFKSAESSAAPVVNGYSNLAVGAEDSKVVQVIKDVQDSVVSINSTTTINNYFYGTITTPSAGSGIIFYEDNDKIYVVTNNHVIEGAQSITVSLDDNNQVQAKILGRDSQSDIAVLTVNKADVKNVEGFDYKVATFGDDSKMEVGQTVIAIGNAAGEGKSATLGIISAKDKKITVQGDATLDVIQTDAAINPGNSGGALVNLSGQVIGINTAKLSQTDVEGMGFAIPSSSVREIAEQIVQTGTVERPYLGISALTVTDQMIESYSLPSGGVMVYSVSQGSGAQSSGLTRGDIITTFKGTEVKSMEELQNLIAKCKTGEKVEIKAYRNGQLMTFNAEIKNINSVN